ncbi:glutathione S-transferase [Psychrobacter sp. 1U2]|uniref:glutathione S-transferase n=1 Tax=Psychrobacter sp. 1U2 TaxID=3453577 RepID=UPI003F487498
MLHLHHLENSRSFRIVWLLEELNVEYELTSYERTKAYLAPDSLKKVHPLGHAPILEVDGRPLVESAFIIEYLLKHYDDKRRFKPDDSDETAWEHYTFWLHFAEASAMPPLVMRLVFNKIVERSPRLIKSVAKGIQKQVEKSMIADSIDAILTMMEAHLQNNIWFAGESFSAADIQVYFVAIAAKSRTALAEGGYPKISAWLKRCQQRDGFKQAENRGGRLAL